MMGRRICGGAFSAAYCIPPATFNKLVRRVMRGDHQWRDRLQCYDIMPHLTGVCVCAKVYKKEFIPQMQKIGYVWSLEKGSEGSYATWREGLKWALSSLSKDTYGTDYSKPFRLISRADHSAFKECPTCKRLRLQ
eukprot:1841974-Pleurochrysis_carterae.AAC.1